MNVFMGCALSVFHFWDKCSEHWRGTYVCSFKICRNKIKNRKLLLDRELPKECLSFGNYYILEVIFGCQVMKTESTVLEHVSEIFYIVSMAKLSLKM